MDTIEGILGGFGGLVQGVVVILLVAVAMIILKRVLKPGDPGAAGNSFRNQLIMFAATFLGLIAVILGLPVDASVRGQLLTLLGILISAAIALSGGTFLSNAMAGIMLKAVGNFRTGDFISTGEHFGRVTERGLFHTEIQTPDRDLTTLPNHLLATSAVKVVRGSGTIVSATISLGYDVAHSRIEKLLVTAAESVGLSEPFVQILDLGDFSVTYRAAGLLAETKTLIAVRSRLRGAILDSLHGAGIEIVSPDFTNARVFSPEQSFIPAPVAKTTAQQPPDSAPVDVVFDKAEDAESLSRLRQKFADSDKEIRESQKALKETGSDEEKKALQARIAFLEKMKETLQQAIAVAEEKESQHE